MSEGRESLQSYVFGKPRSSAAGGVPGDYRVLDARPTSARLEAEATHARLAPFLAALPERREQPARLLLSLPGKPSEKQGGEQTAAARAAEWVYVCLAPSVPTDAWGRAVLRYRARRLTLDELGECRWRPWMLESDEGASGFTWEAMKPVRPPARSSGLEQLREKAVRYLEAEWSLSIPFAGPHDWQVFELVGELNGILSRRGACVGFELGLAAPEERSASVHRAFGVRLAGSGHAASGLPAPWIALLGAPDLVPKVSAR